MPRVVLNRGAFLDDPAADNIFTGVGQVNDMTSELYRGEGTNAQYVSKLGSDDDDGKTWATAKLTVAGAMAALPQGSQNGFSVPLGRVNVGPGIFSEAGPLRFGDSFQLVGATGAGANAPTDIRAANSNHLFLSVWENSALHGVTFANLSMRGVSDTDPTAVQDLLTFAGGFNTVVRDVSFTRAPRWAIRMTFGLMNVGIDNCSFSVCGTNAQGGALLIDGMSIGVVSFLNSQIDRCGVSPIKIIQNHTAQGLIVAIRDVKLEVQTTSDLALHARPIHIVPNADQVGNTMMFQIHNVYANNYSTGWSAGMFESVVFEENTGSGAGAIYSLANIWGDSQYVKAFRSDKTGHQSALRYLRSGSFGSSTNQQGPGFETDGATILAGSVAPTLALPNGSIYLRTGGSGTTDNLYIRRSGAWVGIA